MPRKTPDPDRPKWLCLTCERAIPKGRTQCERCSVDPPRDNPRGN